MPAPITISKLDLRMRARVVSERCLAYDSVDGVGQNPPKHVRAGSALGMLGGKLVVVQDESDWVATVDGPAGPVTGYQLRAPAGGSLAKLRQDGHLQLRGLIVAKDWKGEFLLAFGAGSTPLGRHIARIRFSGADTELSIFDARRFYAGLEEYDDFATSTLNLEGVALVPKGLDGRDAVRLFQRANLKPRRDGRPLSATCDIRLDALSLYLDRCRREPGASLGTEFANVRRYDLEERDEVPYSFTDAALLPSGKMLFAAAAEREGKNLSTTFGVIEPDGTSRYTYLVEKDGTPSTRLAEGIAAIGDTKACLVANPVGDAPTNLCAIDLTGF